MNPKSILIRVLFALLTLRFVKRIIHVAFLIYWSQISKKYAKKRKSVKEPALLWGTTPILNNKYWSAAMRDAGYDSRTIMRSYYSSINEKSDFDLYYNDVVLYGNNLVPVFFKYAFKEYYAFDYILKNCEIFHTSCEGAVEFLNKKDEALMFRRFGIKTIVIPYGSDFFMYSRVINISRRHAMLNYYPMYARKEEMIEQNVRDWSQHCDIFISGSMIDGAGRWDVLPYNIVIIDETKTRCKTQFSDHDGINGPVNILHAPNHRGPKGTEYLIHAIDSLKAKGLKINLILLEKTQNAEVLRVMREEADIYIDELVGTTYGLASMEAMSSGLAVVNNLSVPEYNQAFRRYSYLNECPILSGSIENINFILRVLVRNPDFRKQLGIAGRQFVEKYHSISAAKIIFDKIYEKIWFNKDVDLMNYFHPLDRNSYNNQFPKVEHPLYENNIPAELLNQLHH